MNRIEANWGLFVDHAPPYHNDIVHYAPPFTDFTERSDASVVRVMQAQIIALQIKLIPLGVSQGHALALDL